MVFELEPRDHSLSFPCSLCKKNQQEAKLCKEICGLYTLTSMESFDLKKEVEKLIDSYAKHPIKE